VHDFTPSARRNRLQTTKAILSSKGVHRLIPTSAKEMEMSLVAKYLQLLPYLLPNVPVIWMALTQFRLKPVHVIQCEVLPKQAHTSKDVGQPSTGLYLAFC
jgi:hypothetical protein